LLARLLVLSSHFNLAPATTTIGVVIFEMSI
jgi:hypothetical protein